MLLRIMVMSGPDDGLEIELRADGGAQTEAAPGSFSIGRRETCDVSIPFDTSVSRMHARLELRENGLWLVDEDSRNGTYIGRHRIIDAETLPVGEMFRVGNTWLRVQAVQEQET